MNGRKRPGGRLGAAVLVGCLLAAGSGGAEERFKFGTKDLTIAGGYSFSHNTVDGIDVEDVDGYQLLPHFGIFLSDEHGEPGIRGNFELVIEPTLVHLTTDSSSGTALGLTALARWVFVTPWVVRPYLEVGGGVLGGNFDLRQTNCDVNFLLQVGPGLLWFVSDRAAITAGYRFQHISNARTCSQNLGINSSFFSIGVSYFFP